MGTNAPEVWLFFCNNFCTLNYLPTDIPMKSILVVDDEDAQRKVIIAALKAKGYETFEASDGLMGLELARLHKPHLIISDVYMDNMNGFVMVETLKGEEETAVIPVLMMTSAAQSIGAWDTSLADDYIDKGFSIQALMQKVEKLLKKGR